MTVDTVSLPGPGSASAEPPASAHPRASLSPSRAADFKTCPLLYRFRSIDRLPERPSGDQARGTLVHAVLERLFDLPAEQRTPARAAEMVEPEWTRLAEEHPELASLFDGDGSDGDDSDRDRDGRLGSDRVEVDRGEFLASARDLLGGYFSVEDPRRLAPAEREYLVSAEIDEGRLLLRGYIDRLDISATGDLRVVDYKTGGAPREAFEARALFQLKFYALVLWRTRGVAPKALRLLYLRDAEVCDYHPETDELVRFERTLVALWTAIAKATADQDFRPRPSRLCGWCAHQSLCPAFGGTPPPFPILVAEPASDAQSTVDLDG
jgi:putative RecB family exonuclease